MTKLGKMRDLVGNYFRLNAFSTIVSRDFVNNIKGFSWERGGITLYSCLTPNHIDNLLESLNKNVISTLKLDILSQKKAWLKWSNCTSKISNPH